MCLLETDQRHVVVSSEFFRANVGVVLTRPDRRVLVFERIDKPGEWQLPQGGLDEGEEPAVAALRELHEETGIGSELVDPIAALRLADRGLNILQIVERLKVDPLDAARRATRVAAWVIEHAGARATPDSRLAELLSAPISRG